MCVVVKAVSETPVNANTFNTSAPAVKVCGACVGVEFVCGACVGVEWPNILEGGLLAHMERVSRLPLPDMMQRKHCKVHKGTRAAAGSLFACRFLTISKIDETNY